MCNLILSQSLNLQYMYSQFNRPFQLLSDKTNRNIAKYLVVIVTHLYPLTYWLHCWAIEHIRGNQFPCFLCWSANIQRRQGKNVYMYCARTSKDKKYSTWFNQICGFWIKKFHRSCSTFLSFQTLIVMASLTPTYRS